MRLSIKVVIVLLTFNILFQAAIAGSKNGIETEKAIKLFNKQKCEQAKKIFMVITNKQPDNQLAAYYLGRICLQQKDYENSIKWLEKALNIDKNNSQYHFFLGQAYGLKAQKVNICGKIGAANMVKKEFEKAVALNPENIEARFGLLQFYLRAPRIMGGNKEKAKEQAAAIKKIKQERN